MVLRPLKLGDFGTETLRSTGLARARITPSGYLGFLPAGVDPYEKLSEAIFKHVPALSRGTSFDTYEKELFGFVLQHFYGRDASSIHTSDVEAIVTHITEWLDKRVSKRTLFIPCMLSPWKSPGFSIGPIRFTFIDDYASHAASTISDELEAFSLNKFIEAARKERAHWIAAVEIDGCDNDRADEIGLLAIDLAIVALQLAAPYMDTKTMSSLAMRQGPGQSVSLHRQNNRYSGGFSNLEPGLAIGDGYMAKIVADTALLIDAVGKLVGSFLSGTYRLHRLEEAWCDAAYWLHQGLAESIDSIAVAKLETALEILFRAESAGGSERRLLAALDAFFGLQPNDFISPTSQITARNFAKGFVRDRSRVLHGTWSTLATRLQASRKALEYVATTVTRSYTVELEGYLQQPSPEDEIESFLAWIAARRRKTP